MKLFRSMRRVPLDTEKRSQHSGPTWAPHFLSFCSCGSVFWEWKGGNVETELTLSAGRRVCWSTPSRPLFEMMRTESTRRMKQCHQRLERRRRMKEQEIMHRASSEMPRASISQYCAVMIANPTSGSY